MPLCLNPFRKTCSTPPRSQALLKTTQNLRTGSMSFCLSNAATPKAQVELYLRWLNKYERMENEEAPIALILCAEKSDEVLCHSVYQMPPLPRLAMFNKRNQFVRI